MPKQLALSASHLASCIMWPNKFSFLHIILCTMSMPVFYVIFSFLHIILCTMSMPVFYVIFILYSLCQFLMSLLHSLSH